MEYIKYNKKAQIDSTLVWVVSIFIIVFILSIFLVIVFVMADKKVLTNANDINSNEISNPYDIAISENLFSILNSEIQVNGKSQKVIYAVKDSFNNYFETKSSTGISLIEKYGVDKYGDISGTSRDVMVNSGFNPSDLDKIDTQNQNLARELKKILDRYCNKYQLAIPQGVITEEGILQSSDKFVIDNYIDSYTPIALYNFSYLGTSSDIRFVMLRGCYGGEIIGGDKNAI
jgi:hypothetical protein